MPTGNIAVSTPKPAGTGPISPGLPSPTATTSKPPLGADGAQVGKTAQPTVTRPVRMFRDSIRRQLNGSLGTATLNDSFMDAMMSTPQPKKPKIVRRKISPGETAAGTSASAGQSATAIPPVCDTFRVCVHGYPITALQGNLKRNIGRDDSEDADMVEPDVVSVPGRRKIRFADEHGKDLVAVRYFELEEGERSKRDEQRATLIASICS